MLVDGDSTSVDKSRPFAGSGLIYDPIVAEVAMIYTAAEEQKTEALVELPLELCRIKVKGLSCGLTNGVSLLPSFMHRLEGLLLAIQLRRNFPPSHPDVPADLVISLLILSHI